MIKAGELIGLIPSGGSLTFHFSTASDGKLTLLVDTKYPTTKEKGNSNPAVEAARKPLLITATAEELDSGFMNFLSAATEKRNSLETQLAELEKAAAEAVAKIKEDASKKAAASKGKPAVASPIKKEVATTGDMFAQATSGKKDEDDEGTDDDGEGTDDEGEGEGTDVAQVIEEAPKKMEPAPAPAVATNFNLF